MAALDASTYQRVDVTSTDTAGRYAFTSLPSAQYIVEFDCGNASPLIGEFYDNATTKYGAEPLQIDGDTAFVGIDAVLAVSAGMSGTVTAEEGQPLAGVCVFAGMPDHTGYATSDAQGRWRVDGLKPGTYTIWLFPCEGDSRPWLPEYYGGAQREEDAAAVTVSEGQSVEGLNETLTRGAVVTARGVDAGSGQVLAGCRGAAKDAQWHGDHHTDAPAGDGRFRVLGVPAGKWWFRIAACDDSWYPATWYQGSEVYLEGGTSGPAPLSLTNGVDVAIDVAMTAGGRISGRVFDPGASAPPVGCVVQFHDQEGRSRASAGLSDGAYRSPALAAGRYRVYVYGCVGDYAPRYHPASPDAVNARWIEVQPRHEQAGVDVELYSGAESSLRSIEPACPPDRVPYSHFDDVQVGPHRAAIDCVTWWEIARGNGTEFRPDESVTRGQMASFLARTLTASGAPLPSDPDDAFSDDNGSVHEPSINALAALGIMRGSAGLVRPTAPVDRAQIASFLDRTLSYRLDEPLPVGRDRFPDDSGSVHQDSVNAIAAAGVAGGRADGTYGPNEPVRRAQMASFLARSLSLLVEEGRAAPPG